MQCSQSSQINVFTSFITFVSPFTVATACWQLSPGDGAVCSAHHSTLAFHHELDNLLYLITNVSSSSRFVVHAYKIHRCSLLCAYKLL